MKRTETSVPLLRSFSGAPPIYRPQASISQAKLAPPVYRPLQSTTQANVAPPIYRPQASISQAKLAPPLQSSSSQTRPALSNGRPDSAATKRPARLSPGDIARGCIQRVRPEKGVTIEYDGGEWEVIRSAENDPNISIKITTGKQRQMPIPWAKGKFKIVRPNTDKDFDMRGRGIAGNTQKQKALDMMKAWIKNQAGWVQANLRPLQDLTLANFVVTQNDASVGLPCEWQATWTQTGQAGRTWTLVIDMDRPLAESIQEPHVGWTLSATSTKKGLAVTNQFGHIWVDDVPASRQG
jgi:hypothetical protein